MKKLSLAIIGGGVAGLTFASKAIRMPHFDIKIFQKQPYLGGRTFSKQIQSNTFADLGANIIDFQNKHQQHTIRQYLKDLLQTKDQDKLILLQQPFLIYQTELTKGDYQKKRYYYKEGFKSLINDLSIQLNSSQFEYNYQVDELHRQNGQWKILNKDKQFYHKAFDYLILATSGPHALEILHKSQTNLQVDLGSIKQQLQKVQYSIQISAAFQLKQAPLFSCILFKNKEVTFMSSHSQKYSKNDKKVVVIQYNHLFSSTHRNKSDQQLQSILLEAIPFQMRSWLGQCIFIKKWSPSLIINKQKSNIIKFQSLKDKLLVVGDICNGSSRVTGAMETSLKVFHLLSQVYSPKI